MFTYCSRLNFAGLDTWSGWKTIASQGNWSSDVWRTTERLTQARETKVKIQRYTQKKPLELESSAAVRSSWRTTISKAAVQFENSRRQVQAEKREKRHIIKPIQDPTYSCDICGRRCASSFVLRSHKRSHWQCTDHVIIGYRWTTKINLRRLLTLCSC